jgi:hypothetical protein
VAHTCNPSYSEDRNQEDRSLKPAQANSLLDPISKKPLIKKGLVEWLMVKAMSSSPGILTPKKINYLLTMAPNFMFSTFW